MRFLIQVICSLAVLTASSVSASERGSWAEVAFVHISATDTAIPYISFKGKPMPGCYGDNGGYLEGDKAYSTILAAHLAGREVRPLYDIVGGDTSKWSACRIRSIYVR